jgi:hypothetical protein
LLFIGSLPLPPPQVAVRSVTQHATHIVADKDDGRNRDVEDRRSLRLLFADIGAPFSSAFLACFAESLASCRWWYYSPHWFGPHRHDSRRYQPPRHTRR